MALGALAVCRLASAQSLPFDDTRLRDAAQDDTGQVWAATSGANDGADGGAGGGDGLVRWEANHWQAVVLAAAPKARPLALGRSPQGAVLGVWEVSGSARRGARQPAGQEYLLSEHHGADSRLLGSFTGHLQQPLVFADSTQHVWITGEQKDIYRFTATGRDTGTAIGTATGATAGAAAGAAELAYSITPQQCLPFGRPEGPYSRSAPLHAMEDGRGRIWFWAHAMTTQTGLATLRGLLIFDGKTFEHHATLAGVPDNPVSLVVRKDAEHVWLAMAEDGLYEVDIATLSATRVAPPEPEAFRFVQNIFQIGPEWYCVTGLVGSTMRDGTGAWRGSPLWRWRDGQWQQVLFGLDRMPSNGYLQRPWLLAPEGLWIGALDGGLWFIPTKAHEDAAGVNRGNGSAPVSLDWRQGFPLNQTHRLFGLNDGRWLAVGLEEGSVTIPDRRQLLANSPSPCIRVFKTFRPLVQDAHRRIWAVSEKLGWTPGITAEDANSLGEWNGTAWIKHALPAGFAGELLWYLALDSRERIWLVFGTNEAKPVAIFDPTSQNWATFAGYAAALQSQLPAQPGKSQIFRLGWDEVMVPNFSPDGRICFRYDWQQVRYFDGKTWREWKQKDIRGDKGNGGSGLLDPPFFNRAGNLCVNGRDGSDSRAGTWEWTEAQGWHLTSYKAGWADEKVLEAAQVVAPPLGCARPDTASLARDNFGAVWMTSKRQLYKAWGAPCVPQLELGEGQPFLDGRRILEAFVDAQGNAITRTSNYGMEEYVLLAARLPLPDTRVRLTESSPDSITLDFSPAVKEAGELCEFIWRLDGAAWSAPSPALHVRLDFLADGPHRVEAAAVDRHLQVDPTPAEAAFEVRIDPVRQITRLIALLGARDYADREVAVKLLVSRPALALPALRAARPQAEADQRWWIDAAIQQIEEDQRKAGEAARQP